MVVLKERNPDPPPTTGQVPTGTYTIWFAWIGRRQHAKGVVYLQRKLLNYDSSFVELFELRVVTKYCIAGRCCFDTEVNASATFWSLHRLKMLTESYSVIQVTTFLHHSLSCMDMCYSNTGRYSVHLVWFVG